MTKKELFKEYETLCNSVLGAGRFLDGVNWNSNKATIQNAINCLKTPDSEMNDLLTVIKLAYPNTYKTISNNGNYLTHRFNRLYVFNTAHMVLKMGV